MANTNSILRTIISILIGLALIFVAIKAKDRIVASKKKPQVKEQKQITKIFTQRVQNATIPITINETGNLEALRKVELFAEVQGVLEASNRLFKPGVSYGKGESILTINDDEFVSNLKAQKSILYNLIAQSMPDLRLDYSNVSGKWESYLAKLDFDQPVPDLPEFESEREKFYINSKNIVTTFLNIKNLEERHVKYVIRAPFYATVTEALVYPGTLIRQGQKLGTVISPTVYEMIVSVDESFLPLLKTGRKVRLKSLDGSRSWDAKIARIDPTINTATQGVQVYIQLNGKGLKEGMFLEAEIEANPIESSFELDRKLLIDNSMTYIVQADTLVLMELDVQFFKEKTAIITNLDDGTVLLQNPIPGAYEGMVVEAIQSEGDIQ